MVKFLSLILIALLAGRASIAQPIGGGCPLSGCIFTGAVGLNFSGALSPATGFALNASATYSYPTVADTRGRFWSNTVTAGAGSFSKIDEGNFFNYILTGASVGTTTITQEANVVHPYMELNKATVTGGIEALESSFYNVDGVISGGGVYRGLLSIVHNGATATSTAYYGSQVGLTNDNVSAGSVALWAGYDCDAMAGAGSLPTTNLCIRDASSGGMVTNGGLSVGSLSRSGVGVVYIQGTDNAGGTFPFLIKNLAATNIFYISNDGVIHFNSFTVSAAGVANFNGYQSNGTAGLASKVCVAAAATITITGGLVTATSGC